MSESPAHLSTIDLLTLREVRGYLPRWHGIELAVFIAVGYALGLTVLGDMLAVAHFSGGYSVLLLWAVALVLRWTFQYLLLAGFAGAIVVAPVPVLDWLAGIQPLAACRPSAESVSQSATASPLNAR